MLLSNTLKGESLFDTHFVMWRLIGIMPTKRYRKVYICYSVLVNLMVTIGFPLHLMIGLFQSTTLSDVIKNLAINATSLVCSMKTIAIWFKFKNIQHMSDIIRRQDLRIRLHQDEVKYYRESVFSSVLHMLRIFQILYFIAAVTSEAAVLTNGFLGNWGLMYPAYFPFDPFSSQWLYAVAHVYQLFGVTFEILQNLVNDTFSGMHLALLSGQVHILSMRVAKLGHEPNKTKEEVSKELLKCIQDHKDLLEYRSKLQEVVSLYMFFQIIFTTLNMCVSIVFAILFARDLFTISYYLSYMICMSAQIFPACYYGTIMEYEFQRLSYSLFSSNWMDQDEKFKKNLVIFAEQANKPLYCMAWLFRINIDSFIIASKNAYSLFALIMNMK